MLLGKSKLQLAKPEREAMRRAGRANAELMDRVRDLIQPGVTTAAIDALVDSWTRSRGYVPATLGYQGYKKSCCTSINDVICHGVPDATVLVAGDIVNVDLTTVVDGWHGDSSETFLVGEVSPRARALVQCTFDCLHAAIAALTPGCRVAVIGEAIVALARSRGYSVVEEYVGHGVGRQFHQDPTVPHVPTRQARRERLMPGMCFTIEPMINEGVKEGDVDLHDGWTVRTKDGKLSAQFEHTVLMTENGPEILTQPSRGPRKGHQF